MSIRKNIMIAALTAAGLLGINSLKAETVNAPLSSTAQVDPTSYKPVGEIDLRLGVGSANTNSSLGSNNNSKVYHESSVPFSGTLEARVGKQNSTTYGGVIVEAEAQRANAYPGTVDGREVSMMHNAETFTFSAGHEFGTVPIDDNTLFSLLYGVGFQHKYGHQTYSGDKKDQTVDAAGPFVGTRILTRDNKGRKDLEIEARAERFDGSSNIGTTSANGKYRSRSNQFNDVTFSLSGEKALGEYFSAGLGLENRTYTVSDKSTGYSTTTVDGKWYPLSRSKPLSVGITYSHYNGNEATAPTKVNNGDNLTFSIGYTLPIGQYKDESK